MKGKSAFKINNTRNAKIKKNLIKISLIPVSKILYIGKDMDTERAF